MHRRIVKILVTVAVFVGGAGMLLYSSLGDAEYFHHVDELMEDPESWEGKSLRVHGFVEAGSIQEEVRDQRLHREFVLEREGARIPVRHAGPAPDTFRDLSEVVAIGEIVREDGRFVVEADELTAKCPSKYEGDGPPEELGAGESGIGAGQQDAGGSALPSSGASAGGS